MGGLNTITYQAEGTYEQTKKLHFLINNEGKTIGDSGATIGKGYDLKHHTKAQISKDFTSIGLSTEVIRALQTLSGLSAVNAKAVAEKSTILKDLVLSQTEVDKLYEITYAHEQSEAQRLCTKSDVTKKYGNCNWQTMPPQLQELIVDLKYRGDYHPTMRSKIQSFIVKRDYKALAAYFNNIQNRGKIPVDRWNKRKVLANALLQNTATKNATNHSVK